MREVPPVEEGSSGAAGAVAPRVSLESPFPGGFPLGDAEIRVPTDRRSWEADALVRLLLGGTAVLLAASGLSCGALSVLFVPLLPVYALWLLAVAIYAGKRRQLVIRDGRARFSGLYAPQLAPFDQITVVGEPGAEICIWLGPNATLRLEGPDYGGWSPQAVGRIAATMGAALDVPVNDVRPRGAWGRWRDDPVFRSEVEWDSRMAAIEVRHAGLYAGEPIPLETDVEPHRIRVVVEKHVLLPDLFVELGPGGLECRDARIPLDSIRRAGVFARPETGTAAFHVLHDRGWDVLFTVSTRNGIVQTVRGLRWLADEVMRHASEAKAPSVCADRGDVRDVPATLRAVVSTAQVIRFPDR